MLYRLFMTVLVVFTLFTGRSALAQKTNADEASKIKAEVEKTILFYQNIYASGGVVSLAWDGDVSVEPVEDYYAVTLPDLKVIDHQKKQEIHIGMIAANVVPVAKKNADDIEKWSMSIALPTPIFAYRAGKITGQMNAGEQSIALLWAPSLKQVIDADIAFNAVEILDYTTGLSTFADLFQLKREFRKDVKKNTWTGFDKYTLDGVNIVDVNKTEIIKVKKLVAKSDLESMDFEKATSLQESYSDLSKWSADNKGAIDTVTIIDFIGQGLGLYAGQKAMFHIEEASVHSVETARTIDIGTVDGLIEVTGQGKGFLKSKVWLENVIASTLDDKGQKQIGMHSPFNINFDGILNNIPELKNVKTMVQQVPVQDAQGKNTGTFEPAIRVGDILTLLNKAGTVITVNELKAESALSTMNLNGKVSFDPNAVWGVESVFTILLQGLDKLSQAISSETVGQNQAQASIVQMLQSLGQVVQQGTPAKPEIVSYKIDVKKDGTLLLNGTNIAPLLAMVQPQVQKQMQQQQQQQQFQKQAR